MAARVASRSSNTGQLSHPNCLTSHWRTVGLRHRLWKVSLGSERVKNYSAFSADFGSARMASDFI